jgi:hypothetical protein
LSLVQSVSCLFGGLGIWRIPSSGRAAAREEPTSCRYMEWANWFNRTLKVTRGATLDVAKISGRFPDLQSSSFLWWGYSGPLPLCAGGDLATGSKSEVKSPHEVFLNQRRGSQLLRSKPRWHNLRKLIQICWLNHIYKILTSSKLDLPTAIRISRG